MDPFEILGVDRASLPLPAQAHADQQLSVGYRSKQGADASYQGMESGFDWSNVEQVYTLSRDGRVVLGASQRLAAAPQPLPSPIRQQIDDPSLGSSALRDALIAASPLNNADLTSAIERDPAMGSSDLRQVLEANAPLANGVLSDAIHGPLDDPDLRDVMVASSPLAPAVLSALLGRSPPLGAADLQAVLDAQ